jgi:FAD:protein FMN transferase
MTPVRFEFEAIGTHWIIDIAGDLSSTNQQNLLQKITARIEVFDRTYSRFRDDAAIMKASREPVELALPEDAAPLFELYADLYRLTGGMFTPLVGQLLADSGYDKDYSLHAHEPLVTPPGYDEVVSFHRGILKTTEPVILDFGAAGKGYLIDIVSRILEDENIHNYTVDAGGDIRFRNDRHEPIRIGLENPANGKQVVGTIDIFNESICASSGNRRKWGSYHHIMNPLTLKPVEDIIATWVVAKTTILADGIATCLFFTDAQTLRSHYEFEYLLLKKDFKVEKSKGFSAELFTA